MPQRPWDKFPAEYRAETMRQLAGWIEAGESGSVIGLAGCGRSNLLQFLCHRPDVLPIYLPERAERLALLLVDLSHLPANDPATLYLVILREFYWHRERFSADIQERVTALFMENRATQNPFLAQTALHELLFAFQTGGIRVVLVLNHFDRFAEQATRQTLDTLRGLRDGFKETVCFIAGMVHEAIYLPDPELFGDMLHTLLNRHICWVGAMNDSDARFVITQATHTAPTPPGEAEIEAMIDLTGGFPALLRAVGYWWLEQSDKPPLKKWAGHLMADHNILYWLKRLWDGLTQEEQLALTEVQSGQETIQRATKHRQRTIRQMVKQLEEDYGSILSSLAKKGVCYKNEDGWQLLGNLFAAYVEQEGSKSRGRIWYDEESKQVIQGKTSVKLTKQEKHLLHHFIQHPNQHLSYIQLIQEIWPKDVFVDDEGKSVPLSGNNPLFKLVGNVRAKIKDTASHQLYIVQKEGDKETPAGYMFYPEGRPE